MRLSHFVLVALLASPVAAQEPIVTDRPDFVESSLTVGRGVFQLETSAATDRTNAAGITARTISTPTLFRYGVTSALELRLETDGYVHASATGGTSEDGLADAAIGLKWHALDGAGARPAIAFLLHGDLPSGTRAFRTDGVRPSLRAVGEWELPAGFGLGVMPGVVYDVAGNGSREWHALFGATFGHPITEQVRWYVEYAAEQLPLAHDQSTTAFLDMGTAWVLTTDIQLDLSAQFGLTPTSTDQAFAVGFSRRFR
jgi:hypothetical protein